jgi:hypothetical protein
LYSVARHGVAIITLALQIVKEQSCVEALWLYSVTAARPHRTLFAAQTISVAVQVEDIRADHCHTTGEERSVAASTEAIVVGRIGA